MKVGSCNRRKWISGISAAFIGMQMRPSLSFDMGLTALSGHRFQRGEIRYKIADLISPDKNALLKRARAHAEQSQNMLQNLLIQEDYKIEITGDKDRWGETPARLSFAKGLPQDYSQPNPQYLERALIFDGVCRVFPEGNNVTKIEKFLLWENEARAAKRGLWSLRWYRIRNANNVEDTRDCVGSLQLIEGVVQKVGRSGGRWFLNFGENYREDVTVTIAARYARAWQKEGFSFENLEGSKVRARGFVEWINGPSLAVYHQNALEVLA